MITVLPAMPPAPSFAAPLPCPCGHSDERHDPVALRFCLATVAGDLTRACLCRAVPPAEAP